MLASNKVMPLQKCISALNTNALGAPSSGPIAADVTASRSSGAESRERMRCFVSTSITCEHQRGLLGHAELVSEGHFTPRVDKKRLMRFRRGSSLLRCLNTMQLLLLLIHLKSETAGYTEITAARLAE